MYLPIVPEHVPSLSALSGDLRLRLAGVGYEVDRSADGDSADVPRAAERNSALCETQPQDQHFPL